MLLRSEPHYIHWPAAGEPPASTINDAYFVRGATKVTAHLPFLDGYDRYGVEWSTTHDFAAFEQTNFIYAGAPFDAPGDFYVADVVGFAPGQSLWFRAVAGQPDDGSPMGSQW